MTDSESDTIALICEIREQIKVVSPAHLVQTRLRCESEDSILTFQEAEKLTLPKEAKEFLLNCDFQLFMKADIYEKIGCAEEDRPEHFVNENFESLLRCWRVDSNEALDTDFMENNPFLNFDNRGLAEKIIKPYFFHTKWFPLFSDSFGGTVCVDTDPEINGTNGQLLYILYSGNAVPGSAGPYYLGFKSLNELLSTFLKNLKEGKFYIEDEIIYGV